MVGRITRRVTLRALVVLSALGAIVAMALWAGTGLRAADTVEISRGHADVGILRDGSSWKVAVKDGTGSTPTWRDASDVVLRVSDQARQQLPAGDEYRFLGPAGDMIHLIPQTQADGVLWLGWNTQHPSVRAADPRTITFDVSKKQGPGDLHIYLDYGGFRPPRQLWGPGRSQPVSVPVDTHTHANWAFSEPGRYVVDFTAQITEKDGSRRSATGQLQFLVGDEAVVTSPTGRWEVWGPTALAIGLVVVAALVTIRRILRH